MISTTSWAILGLVDEESIYALIARLSRFPFLFFLFIVLQQLSKLNFFLSPLAKETQKMGEVSSRLVSIKK